MRPPRRPAADRGRPLVTRRNLQITLGALWLLDGALQLQPFMFTRGFAQRVIAPTAAGQPGFVADAVHWSAELIAAQPVTFDALVAGIQVAIGLALLVRRAARPAIVASVAWSLGVWVFGEGAGGLAGGTATFLTGAPGAVLLYALVGLVAWPRLAPEDCTALTRRSPGVREGVARLFAVARTGGDRPARWAPTAWAALWGLFALLRVLPANDSSGALASQLRSNASSAPAWLAHAEHALGAATGRLGAAPIVTMALVEVAIGLLALAQGRPRRIAAVAGIALALAVWVLAQAFGQIPTGMGTDPNSGPLVALLGVALLGCDGREGTTSLSAHLDRDRPTQPWSPAEAA